MFELIDDARREAARKTIVKPKYAMLAVLSVLLVGVEVGILIGKRDWGLLNWLNVGFNGVVFLVIFAPLFRELYKFLRDQEERWPPISPRNRCNLISAGLQADSCAFM